MIVHLVLAKTQQSSYIISHVVGDVNYFFMYFFLGTSKTALLPLARSRVALLGMHISGHRC